jgi:hypothetical protein
MKSDKFWGVWVSLTRRLIVVVVDGGLLGSRRGYRDEVVVHSPCFRQYRASRERFWTVSGWDLGWAISLDMMRLGRRRGRIDERACQGLSRASSESRASGVGRKGGGEWKGW